MVHQMPLHSAIRQVLMPLLLVGTANTAAWAAARVLGTRWAVPLDFGTTLQDGTRWLGSHKTWRGLMAAVMATGVVAALLGYGFALGAAVGSLALLGDASSSFVKRRLRMAPGAEVPGLDQLPEVLLPLLVLQRPLGLGIVDLLIVAATFTLLDIMASRLRRRKRQ
jgi:CDP-diglyceride synthetase